MNRDEIVQRAFAVFRDDVARIPALSLRGAASVDSYEDPEPYDEVLDAPTDEYIEHFAFHAMPFLDAGSWRHYLPRLIAHAFRRPHEPTGLVVFALLHSLRPPDREPPRLATLSADQEMVIVDFLRDLERDDHYADRREEIQQALAEWWLPNAWLRPTPDDLHRKRKAPVAYHDVGTGNYRLTLPTTFSSSGVRHVPQEQRRVESWSGYLCGDAPTRVLIHFEPLFGRSLGQIVRRAMTSMYQLISGSRTLKLVGAKKSRRLDGLVYGYSHSTAELERAIVFLAVVGKELMTVRITSWRRDDVEHEMEKIASSFQMIT